MLVALLRRIAIAVLPAAVAAIPYSEYVLEPSSRTLHPVSVYNVNGTVTGAESLTAPSFDSSLSAPGAATFSGSGSNATFDYGQNIGGWVHIHVDPSSSAGSQIGLTFSESSLWIAGYGSDATADHGLDAILWFTIEEGQQWYNVSHEYQRGGFRYLSLVTPLKEQGDIKVVDLITEFSPMPQIADDKLGEYTGWFHTDDDRVNRVWYAGAYTNSLCTIDPKTGNSLVHLGNVTSTDTFPETDTVTWYNNYTIANSTAVLTDGAKRDRLIWPGDIAISGPSVAVSTSDLDSIRDSITAMFNLQNATTGALPYAGVPFAYMGIFSFTYHLYSLIDLSIYLQYSGSVSYVKSHWAGYKRALAYSLSFIDSSGLANVTTPNDWLRFGMGGHNIEANAILYYTLNQAISLASTLNDSSAPTSNWTASAAGIKSAANDLLWDASASLYRDNETTTLRPQDGNAWAIRSNLTLSSAQSQAVSQALSDRWGPYGAPAPEAGATVSPFISGFELEAHYEAGAPDKALELVRFMWADFMLDDPRMTKSTFIEGYSTNGELHYAPYTNDPRVSHAHGWATGSTSTLMVSRVPSILFCNVKGRLLT